MELSIYTSHIVLPSKCGAWAYLKMAGGDKTIFTGSTINMSGDRLAIYGIIRALKSTVTKFDRITVYTTTGIIVTALSGGFVERWESDGWETINHKPVENADLWQELLNFLRIDLAGTKVNFSFIRKDVGNVFIGEVNKIAKAAAEALQETENMGNVLSLFGNHEKAVSTVYDTKTDVGKTSTGNGFDDLMRRNADNAQRMKEERDKANNGVKRSHYLRIGDTPRSPNFKKED